jgi:hypothetical protein
MHARKTRDTKFALSCTSLCGDTACVQALVSQGTCLALLAALAPAGRELLFDSMQRGPASLQCPSYACPCAALHVAGQQGAHQAV